MYNCINMYDSHFSSSVLYNIVFSKNCNSKMTILITYHAYISVVISVISIVQDNQGPANVRGNKELRSTIEIFKQRKVCCF